MTNELISKYVEISATAIDRLSQTKAAADAAQKQATTAANDLLPRLKGILNPAEYKSASAMLKDHSSTVTLLKAFVEKVASQSVQAPAVDEPGKPAEAVSSGTRKLAFDSGYSADADTEYRAAIRRL